MFVYTFKIKWWRLLSFVLLAVIVAMGIYYMTRSQTTEFVPALPQKEQEGQVWQV
ncbi:MAG: hypothetical protein IJE10_03555 [Clostridia bacterium]|nr:hypothetical protein [Clostridia bacterium]